MANRGAAQPLQWLVETGLLKLPKLDGPGSGLASSPKTHRLIGFIVVAVPAGVVTLVAELISAWRRPTRRAPPRPSRTCP